MCESSGSDFLIITTGIQSRIEDHSNKSRLVMAFVTTLGVTRQGYYVVSDRFRKESR